MESTYEEEMEFFDIERRFQPVLRLILPAKYIATVAVLRWRRLNGEDISSDVQQFRPEWKRIEEFFSRVERLNWPASDIELNPLDNPPAWLQKYLRFDLLVGKKGWRSFDVQYNREDGVFRESRVTNYFHYYHVHLLDALRRELIVPLIPRGTWNRNFPIKRRHIFRATHYFGYLINSHDLRRSEKQYATLAKYVECSKRHVERLFHDVTNETAEAELESKYQDIKKHRALTAKELVSEAGESIESMETFLNLLCKLYIEYENHGRNTLKEELYRDIDSLVELISYGFGIDPKVLFKRSPSPPYGGWRVSLLDWVFPDHLEITRASVERSLRGTLKTIQRWERQPEELLEPDCRELTNKLIRCPYAGIVITINEINESWNSRSPFARSLIVSQFRTLLVSIEDLSRWMIANSNVSSDGRQFFSDLLLDTFKGANWIGPFKSCYEKINEVNHDCTEILGLVDEIVDKVHTNPKSPLRNLLITALLRNYFSHNYIDDKLNRNDLARSIESAKVVLLLLAGSTIGEQALRGIPKETS